MSTEEGRILLFDTNSGSPTEATERINEHIAPIIQAIGALGGPQEGVVGRIKDFEILNHIAYERFVDHRIIVAGSSDGTIRVWALDLTHFATEVGSSTGGSQLNKGAQGHIPEASPARHVGRLLGTFETSNRITCLKAFVMSDITAREPSAISNGNSEKDSIHVDENASESHDD